MLVCWGLLLGGCDGAMSTLEPHGPAAREIAMVWWVMFIGGSLAGGATIVLLLYVVLTARQPRRTVPRMSLVVGGGVALPLVLLLPLTIYGVRLGTVQSASVAGEVRIEVIGHQFWWEVRYPDPDGGPPIVTANEIHMPVGVPVSFELRSADVIHSFWVPNLGGKLDMMPGRTNRTRLQADQPGWFRGQCAEFCGPQHARMRLLIRALPRADFDRWLSEQRGAARTPHADDELRIRGRAEFLSRDCAVCHRVRGTAANGNRGPDLTRVGGRQTLGAGTLDNSEQNLALWIRHNQRLKPDNRMPDFQDLGVDEVRAIAAYLESLR